jgi:hypothetical protein
MPLIFTPSFNHFQKINFTQAWSLFITACKNETFLGTNPMNGKYLTAAILGAAFAEIVEIILKAV